jgi:hypothetical protein
LLPLEELLAVLLSEDEEPESDEPDFVEPAAGEPAAGDPESDEPESDEPEPDESDEELSLLATFFFFPVLKSVSYQPSPFKRNLAAETSLISVDSPQAGQSFKGASAIF